MASKEEKQGYCKVICVLERFSNLSTLFNLSQSLPSLLQIDNQLSGSFAADTAQQFN